MFKVNLVTLCFFLLCSCASARDPLSIDTFSFREPSSNDLDAKVNLWATYYYLPQIKDGAGSFSLRDMQSIELGPRLSLNEWCDSAMEGSVRIIDSKNEIKTYNFAGSTNENLVDCSSIFRFDVSKTKFREARGPYGDGFNNFILAPYRTLATDITKISPGTVLYVPQARGAKIELESGRVIIHDGYFFAGDKGGAIKGNHVDVFIGTHKTAPFFPWIKSASNKTFEGYIVNDKKIISELNELHAF